MTTAAELTPRDIGRTVTVTDAHSTITGMLMNLGVETDWITEATVAEHPDNWRQTPGRKVISLAIGPWSTSSINPNATVTFDA